MCTRNGKLNICRGCSFLTPMISWHDFSRLFFIPTASDCFPSISTPPGRVHIVIRTGLRVWVYVRVSSYLCWFSLSSCCLRRVGRNLLLARAASMSSISLLLNSRMAERIRRLSSRSTVPSSCTWKKTAKKKAWGQCAKCAPTLQDANIRHLVILTFV